MAKFFIVIATIYILISAAAPALEAWNIESDIRHMGQSQIVSLDAR